MVDFISVTEADLPLVRSLAERIWRACYREMLPAEQIDYMLGWMYSEEAIRRDLREGVVYEIIAGADISCIEKPIGYLAFGPHDASGAEWKLHKLYVLPEHHGAGIGQRAIEHVCASIVAKGARRLSLNVNKQNHRALRAYERAGFRKTGSVVNDIGGGFVMDDFVLVREVPVTA